MPQLPGHSEEIISHAHLHTKTPGSFRLLIFSVPIFIAAIGVYFNSRPYTYVVRGEPTVVCANGTSYPAEPNNIGDLKGLRAYIENGYTDSEIQANDLRARKLCTFGVINDFVPFRNVPQSINYAVRPGITGLSLDTPKNPGVILSHK